MLQRLMFAFAIALGGFLATTAGASAAFDPDREEMVIGTFAVALGLLLVLALFYGIKWYFGWDKQPETDEFDQAHH